MAKSFPSPPKSASDFGKLTRNLLFLKFMRAMEQLGTLRTVEQAVDKLETDDDKRKYLLLLLGLFRRDAEVLAQRLVEGSISLAQWEEGMAQLLKAFHVQVAVIVESGDWALLGRHLRAIEKAIREQLEYLHGFAEAIQEKVVAGEELTTSVHSRAKLYVGAAWAFFWLLMHGQKEEKGFSEVSWNLTPAEHCEDCLALAEKGWMPIGELTQFPGDGQTQCLTNCKCYLDYR